MTVYLIRHGMTAGNLEKRYIGRTDEPLCEAGIRALGSLHYPVCSALVCSPMRRCTETAAILFPGQPYTVCEDLRECDFGRFEGKNYRELAGNRAYQEWIDSGGMLPFPGGESPAAFRARCVSAFRDVTAAHPECPSLALVVHGGTVMSILEALALPHRGYYDRMTENGHGWRCTWNGTHLMDPEAL